jgi:hypothetical protein
MMKMGLMVIQDDKILVGLNIDVILAPIMTVDRMIIIDEYNWKNKQK